MKYHVIHIQTDFAEEWQKDLFDQHICELGVDTIDPGSEPEKDSHADYYIQSDIWEQNRDEIEAFCDYYEGIKLLGVEACPDENWNAAWEAEHPMQELPLGVKIIPHCAFGAGHHETTSMMIEHLQSAITNHQSPITNHQSPFKRVLDHGTGTGVLAIFAKRLGAEQVVAVDIDEKSVVNAQENAALNSEEIDVRLGDTVPVGTYDLILANIHRNILLANMSAYATHLAPKGELWLSGFYEEDCPILQRAAEQEGLTHIATYTNNDWRMLRFIKQ